MCPSSAATAVVDWLDSLLYHREAAAVAPTVRPGGPVCAPIVSTAEPDPVIQPPITQPSVTAGLTYAPWGVASVRARHATATAPSHASQCTWSSSPSRHLQRSRTWPHTWQARGQARGQALVVAQLRKPPLPVVPTPLLLPMAAVVLLMAAVVLMVPVAVVGAVRRRLMW
jgi:hypothetical protein